VNPTPRFSSDWFSGKAHAWQEHVVPRLAGRAGATWLEVGSYEGRSALWTLEHVLTGPGTRLYCLDVFDSELPYLGTWAPNLHYEEVFDANVAGDPRVVKLKGRSVDLLPGLAGTILDGAYLDGEHEENTVRAELELVWPMLAPQAVLVCDDYGFPPQPGARRAIDAFLAGHPHHQVLFTGFQILILKT